MPGWRRWWRWRWWPALLLAATWPPSAPAEPVSLTPSEWLHQFEAAWQTLSGDYRQCEANLQTASAALQTSSDGLSECSATLQQQRALQQSWSRTLERETQRSRDSAASAARLETDLQRAHSERRLGWFAAGVLFLAGAVLGWLIGSR